MASFGAYLNSISVPLAQKVLSGLGFGVVTFVGLQAAFDSLKSIVVGNMNSVASQIGALFYLAGFDYAIGLILSAAAMRLSMIAVKRLQLV